FWTLFATPVSSLAFFFSLPRPPELTLFPYTTLFRSRSPCRVRFLRTLRYCRSVVLYVAPDTRAGRGAGEDSVRGPSGRNATVGKDRKSTRLNSSHQIISYAVFCLKKKNTKTSVVRYM